jgi:CheY-like chemotaxis protein
LTEAHSPTSPDSGAPAMILLVEDDEAIRMAVRELLEAEGYEVITAGDGEEALRHLSQTLPALVITDLQMPNVDGAQLCQRLRSDSRTADVPIVVLTAAHRTEVVEKQVDAILRKPFDIDALLGTIAQFIRPTLPPRRFDLTPSVRLTLGPIRPSFVLYVTLGTSSSARAEKTVRAVAETRGARLEVVDVVHYEDRARRDGIQMTPTLVRNFGMQRDVYLGDLSEPTLVEEFVSGS